MKKILFDTDLGGDIDDALALALAINSPEIEIVGITTVYISAEWRAKIILRMLDTYDRKDIEVALGAERPLIGKWDESHIPDTKAAAKNMDGVIDTYACDYIIDKVNEYANDDLTILAIGPLTNIGLALAKDPTIAKKAKLVMMGGQVNRAHPEWNIQCDPEAARIVFESGIPIDMIGLDVTNRCKLDHDHINFIKTGNNKRSDLISELMATFLESFDFMPTLHDPLALATMIWPDLVTFEEKTIKLETKGEFTRGVTVDLVNNYEPNANVAVDVKVDEFREKLLERIIK